MKLFERTHIYTQEDDCCSPRNMGQQMTVLTQEGGGGSFVVISTERWAIEPDEIDAFCAELKKMLEGLV